MNTFQIEVKKLKSKCKDANSEDDIKIATNIFISKLGDLFNFEVRQKMSIRMFMVDVRIVSLIVLFLSIKSSTIFVLQRV